ncbi:MAG: M20/M25/M40 family metallo-hydrolase [Candidatus Aminicenantes bacterium]|nr:M20/M25/M40 family metallo-hydrolase [Candidatus Aminicenantes bacterium]
MRKTYVSFFMICLLAFSPLTAQQEEPEKKVDPMANFSIVEQVKPIPENMKDGFDSITAKDAVAYLNFLTSDLLEGRDTASAGYDIAAQYAACMFELWGIKPAGDFLRMQKKSMFGRVQTAQSAKRGYFQNIALREHLGNKGTARVDWQKGQLKKSFAFDTDIDYTIFSSGTQTLTAPVVFVGYGIREESLKFDEYKNLDVRGKIVMMLSETPGKDDPGSPFRKGELMRKYYAPRMMMRMRDPKTKLAEEMGAAAVLMVENSPQKNPDVARRILESQQVFDELPIMPGEARRISLIEGKGLPMPWDSIPTIRISREMADKILGLVDQDIEALKEKIETTLQSHSMSLQGTTMTVENEAETKLVNSMNVLGYIEGADPELKNEAIVIGAHLDHLGKRGAYIFNGADDDASGCVGVMEIAEALAKNPVKPKRSILFALWTGEEKGLLGSRYYVANPYFPLEKTVADLNLDMISRTWDMDQLKRMSRMFGMELTKEMIDKIDPENFINVSFDADTPELAEIVRANNEYVGLIAYLRKSEEAMGGSDHAPFAMSNLPWTFFMAAMTEDYHQPSDTVDKINPKLMEKIIRLTYLTAFSLADK